MIFQGLSVRTSKSGPSPLPGRLGGVGRSTPQPLLQVIPPGAGPKGLGWMWSWAEGEGSKSGALDLAPVDAAPQVLSRSSSPQPQHHS